jgi:hypothetical protein
VAGKGYEDAIISGVLRNPEKVVEVRRGRVILQSRTRIGPHNQLIRVFVDVDVSPAKVVTVYRTSKIDKYWSVR